MNCEEYKSQNILLISHKYMFNTIFFILVLKRFDQNEIHLYVFKTQNRKKTDSNSSLFGVSPLRTINYTHLQC